MSIPIEHEDTEELRKWGLGLDQIKEACFFCKQGTRMWFAQHTPVCETCAQTHEVSDFLARSVQQSVPASA